MVKLNKLAYNNVYYVTQTPLIMPETPHMQRKDIAYAVWAPNVEAGLSYLSSNTLLRYRYLTKYYVRKKWMCKVYQRPAVLNKMNSDGEFTDAINKYRKGNLKAIDGVTSFIPGTSKSNALKRLNVLVEMNYVFDAVLNNPKDHRYNGYKAADLLAMLTEHAKMIDALGGYSKVIVIPMDLWFKKSDYANPTKTMRSISQNPMGALLGLLCDPSNLEAFGTVVLVDGNVIGILNTEEARCAKANSPTPDKVPDPTEEIRDTIIAFMKRAMKKHVDADVGDGSAPATAEPEIKEPTLTAKEIEKAEKAEQSMQDAEEKTREEIKAERVLASIKVDPDSLGDDDISRVKDIVNRSEGKPARRTDDGSPHVVPSAIKTPRISKSADTIDTSIPDIDIPDTPDMTGLENMKMSVSDMDALMSAKMSGHSVASAKRNQLLKEKYKELKAGETPLTDLVEVESAVSIPETPVHANTINPSLKSIKGHRFEEVYDKTLAQHDIVSILMHFSSVRPALYLNKDIKIEDISTRTDRLLKYTVEFEDEDRKRHHFSFKMPKMYKSKYLFLNGQELTITHQKLPYPITKVSADRCQLVTNYNKIFIYRYGTALSPRMSRLKKVLSSDRVKNVVVRKGDCTALNRFVMTTIEFDDLASKFTKIMIGTADKSVTFYFNPDDHPTAFDLRTARYPKIEDEPTDVLIPIAVRKLDKDTSYQYYLSGTTNQVYGEDGDSAGELSNFIVNTMIEFNPALESELGSTSAGSKYVYSRVHIMDKEIPLIIVMGAADPGGLLGALEKGKINYQFVEKRSAVDKNVTGVIPFADGYLVYDRYPYENSLLMNGLSVVNTKEYGFYDFNVRDTYVDILETMCGQRTLADNLGAFYYMMVDPITKDVLHRLNMPTDFTTLLYYCNGVLVDNTFQIDSNYENSRLRSNEIVMAHLYRELAVAWSNYRSGRTDTFSIPENAIITLLLTSKIVDPKSKLNITLELENDRNVKLKGPSGMNEDHSFTIEKRAYHPSMRGIVSTNSTPSGEVGINRHMVINPNIVDARGFISINKADEYDGTELLSPGEAMAPFSAEAADIERLCMSISQAKHLVPVESQCSPPVSFDFERIAPYLSNDFAFQAKQDGKVIEISEDVMIIQYKDGTTDDIDLSRHPERNTDGGFYIMNQMESKYKVGQSFKSGEILAYNPKAINNLDFFGDPCANVGTLARVAFESNGNVYEDSGYMTDDFAHRFATKITRQKRIILSPFANVKYIAKVGQSIQSNDPILTFDDTEDEFSSQLLASIADQLEDEEEMIATSAPVVSKYSGVISDINITYTVPLEEMTPSLRKIVQDYVKSAAKREKVIAKYGDVRDANTIAKSSEMAIPDSHGKVAGTKIDRGVIIDFYIEYVDVAGNGDKGSIGALKYTTCDVIPTELAGFTDFNPNRKIDVYVASFGAFKRMVADVEKVGILTKVLVERKRQMGEKYLDRIRAELKK